MQSRATTVEEYLKSLPDERQAAISKLRTVIRKNMPKGFEETISCGMIGYVIPHSLYPAGYHCNPAQPLLFMGIASQKNFISIHHMGLYGNPELLKWFVDAHAKQSPKKLDMGKSCIRYKNADDIPFKLIAELSAKVKPKEWISWYEKVINRK
jgi:hypothetical protein